MQFYVSMRIWKIWYSYLRDAPVLWSQRYETLKIWYCSTTVSEKIKYYTAIKPIKLRLKQYRNSEARAYETSSEFENGILGIDSQYRLYFTNGVNRFQYLELEAVKYRYYRKPTL